MSELKRKQTVYSTGHDYFDFYVLLVVSFLRPRKMGVIRILQAVLQLFMATNILDITYLHLRILVLQDCLKRSRINSETKINVF